MTRVAVTAGVSSVSAGRKMHRQQSVSTNLMIGALLVSSY